MFFYVIKFLALIPSVLKSALGLTFPLNPLNAFGAMEVTLKVYPLIFTEAAIVARAVAGA